MDRVSSLIYPGSKTLAGWWRQLQLYQPRAFWVGYAFLHRIEAHVNLTRAQPVEPFTHLVLQALALENADGASADALQARLRLPVAAVQRVLVGMERDGMLARPGNDHWHTTERGQQALRQRSYPVAAQERRAFTFVEHLDPLGQRLGSPCFLPLLECAGATWPADEAHRFDLAWLQGALAQPAEWKNARGFPAEIQAISQGPDAEAWQQVIVDRPERLLLALVRAKSDELLGFAVKVEGWTLNEQAPVLRLPALGSTAWPEIAQTPTAEVWQEAWRSWCRQRQLPMNEVEICALNFQSPRLEVQPPPRLLQRLQAAKSDLFKGDAWLLLGDGFLRSAVQLSIRSA